MSLEVRAKRVGYYGVLREPDGPHAEFEISNESELGSWMEPIGWEPKKKQDKPVVGKSKKQDKPEPAASDDTSDEAI